MTTQTHTYSNPQDWDSHPLSKHLESGIHICASSNLCAGISTAYPRYNNLCSLNDLMKKLYPTWNSSELQLEQYLELSSWLQENKQLFPSEKLFDSFHLNTKGLVMLMRKLAESGVKPDDLKDTFTDMDLRGQNVSEKELMFLKIWTAVDNGTAGSKYSYANYRNHLNKRQLTINELYNALNSISDPKRVSLLENPIIFLHGFYFITPEQQFFLEQLKKSFKVVMFLYYEPKYERTFSFMRLFIQPKYGWEAIPYTKDSSAMTNHISDLFLRVYENGNDTFKKGSHEVLSYANFFDFTQDVIHPNYPAVEKDSRRKVINIFSPNASEMNELLLNHYPELDQKNRNFLTYPVGRFFSTIHEIYQDGQYRLTYDQLHELFTSGWLYNSETRQNARNYTQDLKDIEAYVERAETLNQWIALLKNLKKQILFIEKQFPLPVDASRIQKSTRSPFTKNSHFSMETDRLNDIIKFLFEIKDICNELFESGQTGTKINRHFKKLELLMNKRIGHVRQNFNDVEQKLVEDLRTRLSYIKSESDLLYSDLHEAVSLYLSGKFDEKDEKLIRPFMEIDGEAFKQRNVDYDYKVYVSGLDEHSLPLTVEAFHWPLQKETWIALGDRVPRISYDYMRTDAKKYISRYLFYIMLRFIPKDRLHLSWIRYFIGRDERKSALYIRQLELPTRNYTPPIHEKMDVQTRQLTDVVYSQDELESGYQTLLYNDFFAEYVQCPKRFYYSYLMQEYPVFRSEYIQIFLFTELIKISGKSAKYDANILYNELDAFFPQWISLKKRLELENALNYAYKRTLQQNQVDEEIYVSEIRKNFQFPGLKNESRDTLFEKAVMQRQAIEESLMAEQQVSFDAISGYHCRFCPHNDLCPAVTHGIDLKEDIDD
ncbi:hypothetical protein [Psychrobacillus sp. BL-248-WT-3]|uniref:hypothetical protein n=1 Tax=Psychrobacillus sp. BL-248-WT-3 TaxID=2725306 RepID=UPI00146A88F6|nr:hypothetical protein [Psychrobacillus sp. BL-248-WT-3]NME06221.1 hypothetical protein [Psychrobacillus sp. BL-248-WT-3]